MAPAAAPLLMVARSLMVSCLPETAVLTNAVVAICVEFVLAAAVGAVGVPVSAGDAVGA